jgi:hypothetical protein
MIIATGIKLSLRILKDSPSTITLMCRLKRVYGNSFIVCILIKIIILLEIIHIILMFCYEQLKVIYD